MLSNNAVVALVKEVHGIADYRLLSESCLSLLELCHYLMVTGGFKAGTETVFGRRCSTGFT